MQSGALDLAVAHVEHSKTWRLELQKMLLAVDDGDDRIDFAEFLTLMHKLKQNGH